MQLVWVKIVFLFVKNVDFFISKCTNLHYFRSKVAEKKTRMSLDFCGHQNDDELKLYGV